VTTASGGPIGVVVMAYGTPGGLGEVEGFYTDVRRGRPPSPEQLADLVRRYEAVGGTSSLAARTAEQVAGIQAALDVAAPGRYVCRYGSKHSSPDIESAIHSLAVLGAVGVVGIVLAPHYSAASVGEYVARARSASDAAALPSAFVEDWHDHPVLISLLVERVRAAYETLGVAPDDAATELLVTAHSLPVRIIESGDGYDVRLHETAELVAAGAGAGRWRVCWQSAGRTPEPWIGPDVLEVLRSLPSEGIERAVVCPAGFTSDHLEVNYDIDIEAQGLARSVGLKLARTESLNAEPRLCEALAGLVRLAAKRNGLGALG
jgi:ferrochelatase